MSPNRGIRLFFDLGPLRQQDNVSHRGLMPHFFGKQNTSDMVHARGDTALCLPRVLNLVDSKDQMAGSDAFHASIFRMVPSYSGK
jgi:hypothetical protein